MKTRNTFIDLVKLIACFMVILIHTDGIGVMPSFVLSITRWAVPFFFTLTGIWFFHNDLSTENIKHCAWSKVKKFVKILICVKLVYLSYSLLWYLCNGYTLSYWLNLKFSLPSIIKWLVNSGLVHDKSNIVLHVWYIVAIIKCSLLFYIIAPIYKKIYKAITIELVLGLYIANIFYGSYMKSVRVIWFMIGFTFINVGIFFSEYMHYKYTQVSEQELKKWKHKIKYIAIMGILLGIVASLVETYFLGVKEIYLGSFIITISLLLLSECDIEIRPITDITANIYYYHVLFLNVVNLYIQEITWYKPLIIMGICVGLFSLLEYVKEKSYVRERKEVHTHNG